MADGNRLYSYDVVRVVAMFFVIAVHSLSVVVVFLLSLLLAVAIDKLIVKPAQKLFDKIVPMPKKETSTINQ